MLTLIAAWQAMLAAMRARIFSRFERLLLALELLEYLVQHVLDFVGVYSGRSGLYRDGARSEGLGLKAVASAVRREISAKMAMLRGRELHDDGHQQPLRFRRAISAAASEFSRTARARGNVLVDDPESLRIDGEDERVADLTQRA